MVYVNSAPVASSSIVAQSISSAQSGYDPGTPQDSIQSVSVAGSHNLTASASRYGFGGGG
jgi:hypothetical protein